jgi:hypothetical protein
MSQRTSTHSRRLRRAAVVGAASLVAASVSLIAPAAQAAPPANDAWEAATMVSSIPFEDIVDTTEATRDAVNPPDLGLSKAHTVWFQLTPPVDGPVLVSTVGTDFEHKLTLYHAPGDAQSPEDWILMKGDRGSVAYGAALLRSLQEGEHYYYVIGTQGSIPGGTARLVVRDPAHVKVTLDDGRVSRVDGSAVLRGTLSSDQPVTVWLAVLLKQASGRWVADTWEGKRIKLAEGEATPWRMRFTAERAYHVGRARIVRSYLKVFDAGTWFRMNSVLPHAVTLR